MIKSKQFQRAYLRKPLISKKEGKALLNRRKSRDWLENKKQTSQKKSSSSSWCFASAVSLSPKEPKEMKSCCRYCSSSSHTSLWVGQNPEGQKKLVLIVFSWLSEEDKFKLADYVDNHFHWHIKNPVEYLRCSFFTKIVNGF